MVDGTESFQQARWQGMIVVFNRAQDHPLMHSSVARRVPCTVRCCHSKLKNVVSTYTKPPARGSIAAAGHSAWGVEGTSFTQSAEWETGVVSRSGRVFERTGSLMGRTQAALGGGSSQFPPCLTRCCFSFLLSVSSFLPLFISFSFLFSSSTFFPAKL